MLKNSTLSQHTEFYCCFKRLGQPWHLPPWRYAVLFPSSVLCNCDFDTGSSRDRHPVKELDGTLFLPLPWSALLINWLQCSQTPHWKHVMGQYAVPDDHAITMMIMPHLTLSTVHCHSMWGRRQQVKLENHVLHFSCYTNCCTSSHQTIKLLAFVDVTTLNKFIYDEDNSTCRLELVIRCSKNNLGKKS